jgi:hypothetical protein
LPIVGSKISPFHSIEMRHLRSPIRYFLRSFFTFASNGLIQC